jgi:hypothetical protein
VSSHIEPYLSVQQQCMQQKCLSLLTDTCFSWSRFHKKNKIIRVAIDTMSAQREPLFISSYLYLTLLPTPTHGFELFEDFFQESRSYFWMSLEKFLIRSIKINYMKIAATL